MRRLRNLFGASLAIAALYSCGGGGSSYGGGGGAPSTYSVGGTISGLTAAGLILANGNDSVSPAVGAVSFTFPTALASGSNYAVTITAQPNYLTCQVTNGSGQLSSAPVTSVVVTCTRGWVSKSGSGQVGAKGVYGTLGVPAVGNVPGAREGSVSWTDAAGDLWLFGGNGYDSAGTLGSLNDLWRYSPVTGQWTWVSGSNTVHAPGVYGTLGMPTASNVPGARGGSVSWIDHGDLWLFGGDGYGSAGAQGELNDLWRYSPANGQWTWVGGSNTVNAPGVYGALGVAAAGNVPGAREGSVSWADSAGNLWLFGGFGFDSAGTGGDLNDLWRYSPGTGQWTWMSGSNTVSGPGVYGTLSVTAASNMPGARFGSVSWTDSAGDLWLFGGNGYDSAGTPGFLNDLWRYSSGTGQWTWVSGSNTVNGTGVYGTAGVAAAANVPGARDNSVSWIDNVGNLWLFGGSYGFRHWVQDLWRYSPGTGLWTWIGGGNGDHNGGPSARSGAVSWTDSTGNLWLFGGSGVDEFGKEGDLNDLWVY